MMHGWRFAFPRVFKKNATHRFWSKRAKHAHIALPFAANLISGSTRNALTAAVLPLLATAGCDTVAPAPKDGGTPVTAAFFSQPPTALFQAARSACTGPNESFHTPRKGVSQCRILLDPETTATMILGFDGTVNDLPRLVISMASLKAESGHVVAGCAYLLIPQKNGHIRRLVHNDRVVDAKLRELMRRADGQPLAQAPVPAVDACLSV